MPDDLPIVQPASAPFPAPAAPALPARAAEATPADVSPDGERKWVMPIKLSIVIPVYNEEATIHQLIRRVIAAPLQEGIKREIICVNDCSTDRTGRQLEQLWQMFPDEDIKVLHKAVNQGKGAALRDGFKQATGDLVLIQDADLEYDPDDYTKLLEPILEGKADVVFGSRFIGEPHRVMYFWHYVANRGLTALSNMFTNLNLTDMEVCYKVFRKPVLDQINIKCNRFGVEPEMTAKVAKIRPRLRIFEVGVAYYGRSYEEGKKITWRDGIKAVAAIVRFRFSD